MKILDPIKLEIDNDDEVYWVTADPNDEAEEDEPVPSKRRRSSRKRRAHLHSRYDKTSGHRQLMVNDLLLQLRQNIPADALCLISLTMWDLYETEPDLFVAGMAAGSRRVAAFSFLRYDPGLSFSKEFWHELRREKIKESDKYSIMLQRSCKLLVHELAHLLGVDHCVYFDCCMNGSGHLSEDFRQPIYLCPVDLHKLQVLCGFDIVKRYEKLQQFFRTHGLHEEADWVLKRLQIILKQV